MAEEGVVPTSYEEPPESIPVEEFFKSARGTADPYEGVPESIPAGEFFNGPETASRPGAFARGFAEDVGPATVGLGAGMLAGAGLGAAYGSTIGPWGTLAGGVIGGLAAGYGASKLRDYALEETGVRAGTGPFSERQRQTDLALFPYSREAGSIAGGAIGLRPGGNLVERGISGVIGAGAAGLSDYATTGEVDPYKMLMGGAAGVALPNINRQVSGAMQKVVPRSWQPHLPDFDYEAARTSTKEDGYYLPRKPEWEGPIRPGEYEQIPRTPPERPWEGPRQPSGPQMPEVEDLQKSLAANRAQRENAPPGLQRLYDSNAATLQQRIDDISAGHAQANTERFTALQQSLERNQAQRNDPHTPPELHPFFDQNAVAIQERIDALNAGHIDATLGPKQVSPKTVDLHNDVTKTSVGTADANGPVPIRPEVTGNEVGSPGNKQVATGAIDESKTAVRTAPGEPTVPTTKVSQGNVDPTLVTAARAAQPEAAAAPTPAAAPPVAPAALPSAAAARPAATVPVTPPAPAAPTAPVARAPRRAPARTAMGAAMQQAQQQQAARAVPEGALAAKQGRRPAPKPVAEKPPVEPRRYSAEELQAAARAGGYDEASLAKLRKEVVEEQRQQALAGDPRAERRAAEAKKVTSVAQPDADEARIAANNARIAELETKLARPAAPKPVAEKPPVETKPAVEQVRKEPEKPQPFSHLRRKGPPADILQRIERMHVDEGPPKKSAVAPEPPAAKSPPGTTAQALADRILEVVGGNPAKAAQLLDETIRTNPKSVENLPAAEALGLLRARTAPVAATVTPAAPVPKGREQAIKASRAAEAKRAAPAAETPPREPVAKRIIGKLKRGAKGIIESEEGSIDIGPDTRRPTEVEKGAGVRVMSGKFAPKTPRVDEMVSAMLGAAEGDPRHALILMNRQMNERRGWALRRDVLEARDILHEQAMAFEPKAESRPVPSPEVPVVPGKTRADLREPSAEPKPAKREYTPPGKPTERLVFDPITGEPRMTKVFRDEPKTEPEPAPQRAEYTADENVEIGRLLDLLPENEQLNAVRAKLMQPKGEFLAQVRRRYDQLRPRADVEELKTATGATTRNPKELLHKQGITDIREEVYANNPKPEGDESSQDVIARAKKIVGEADAGVDRLVAELTAAHPKQAQLFTGKYSPHNKPPGTEVYFAARDLANNPTQMQVEKFQTAEALRGTAESKKLRLGLGGKELGEVSEAVPFDFSDAAVAKQREINKYAFDLPAGEKTTVREESKRFKPTDPTEPEKPNVAATRTAIERTTKVYQEIADAINTFFGRQTAPAKLAKGEIGGVSPARSEKWLEQAGRILGPIPDDYRGGLDVTKIFNWIDKFEKKFRPDREPMVPLGLTRLYRSGNKWVDRAGITEPPSKFVDVPTSAVEQYRVDGVSGVKGNAAQRFARKWDREIGLSPEAPDRRVPVNDPESTSIVDHLRKLWADESGALDVEKMPQWIPKMGTRLRSMFTSDVDPAVLDFMNQITGKTTRLNTSITEKVRDLIYGLRKAVLPDTKDVPTRQEAGQMYRAWENKELGKLPPRLREYFNKHVDPVIKQAEKTYDELRDVMVRNKFIGWEKMPERTDNGPEYAQFIFRRKNTPFNEETGYDVIGNKSRMSLWTQSVEPREWFVLQKDGSPKDRQLYRVNANGTVVFYKDGVGKGAAWGSHLPADFDPQQVGSKWSNMKVDHAKIDEIMQHGREAPENGGGKPVYHDNPLLVASDAYVGLTQSLERAKFVDKLLNDPTFQSYKTNSKVKAEEMWGKNGFEETIMPQFDKPGLKTYFPKQVAWALNDAVKQGFHYNGGSFMDTLARFSQALLKPFYFVGSQVHVWNELDKWLVGRGHHNLNLPQTFKTFMTALKSVRHQDHLQSEIMEAGGNPMFAHAMTSRAMPNIAKILKVDIATKPWKYDPIRKVTGYDIRPQFERAYQGSNKMMWWQSDALYTSIFLDKKRDLGGQSAQAKYDELYKLQKVEKRTPEQTKRFNELDSWNKEIARKAVHETEKIIDGYVMPATLGKSFGMEGSEAGRWAQQFLADPATSNFGRFSVGLYKTLANVAKNMAGQNENMSKGASAALGFSQAGMLLFMANVFYPWMSKLYQQAPWAKPESEVEKRGVTALATIPSDIAHKGMKDGWTKMQNRLWSPSAAISTGLEAWSNRDRLGRPIVESGSGWGEVPGQLGEYAVGKAVSPLAGVSRSYAQEGPGFAATRFVESNFGVKTPSAAQTKYETQREQEEARLGKARLKHPRGVIESAGSALHRAVRGYEEGGLVTATATGVIPTSGG